MRPGNLPWIVRPFLCLEVLDTNVLLFSPE
jgi:hypothetical protein